MKTRLHRTLVFLFILETTTIFGLGTPVFAADEKDSNTLDTTFIKKGRLITVVSGASVAYIGSMSYLQFVWYKDRARVLFEFYNDLGGYNQIDKCGHV